MDDVICEHCARLPRGYGDDAPYPMTPTCVYCLEDEGAAAAEDYGWCGGLYAAVLREQIERRRARCVALAPHLARVVRRTMGGDHGE